MKYNLLQEQPLRNHNMKGKAFLLFFLAFFAILNFTNAQKNLSSGALDTLRQAYEQIKSPEITFDQFVQTHSYMFSSRRKTNSKIAALAAPQDTYCSKVRSYCSNGDFETGLDQNQWTGAYGTDALGIYPNPFALTYGFSSGALSSSAAHQTIVDKASGNDPTTGIPLVAANGGTKSLRLGNTASSNGTEVLAKTIVVDANETILSFYYAVVLEDPGHPFNDQPAFSVRAYDCATGLELKNVCDLGNGTNVVVSDAKNPFFKSALGGSIAYRDWSLAQINLSAYIGKTVVLVFENKDCNQGAHYGYTYLDNIFSSLCPVNGPVLTGQGSVSLNKTTTSTCGTGNICVDYTVPSTSTATGNVVITLDIYQSGTKITTLTSPTFTTNSSYCFAINPSTLGLSTSAGGFDYSITGRFTLSGFALAPITLGSPPNGQVSGANNDYMMTCSTVIHSIYYSKPTGDLHNVTTWGHNPDGSGDNPPNFTGGNDYSFVLANRPGIYTMTGSWTLSSELTIPGGSQLQINGNTLSIRRLSGDGLLSGTPTSNLIATGGDFYTLRFIPGGNNLNNLTMVLNTGPEQLILGAPLNLYGVLQPFRGTFVSNNNLTLKSTATTTAMVAPIGPGVGFTGNATVERYIPARRAWRLLAAPIANITTPATATTSSSILTNSQANLPAPLTTSTGQPRPASYGNASFSLNAAHTALAFTVTVYNVDLTGSQTPDPNDNVVAAHIHAGPLVSPTINGPVVWGFFGAPFNDNNPNDIVITPFTTGVGGTISGKWDAAEGNGTTLTAQLPNLLNGHAYINFHTTQFPGGEVHGAIQLVEPTPSINDAWQEHTTNFSSNPNPNPGFGTHITQSVSNGADGLDFNIETAMSSLKMHNNLNNTWVPVLNTNTTAVNSKAWFTFVRGDRSINMGFNTVAPNNTVLRATGPLRIGDQTFPIAATGFTAIPNPYAAPIDFGSIASNNSNIVNSFTVVDPKLGSTGAFVNVSFNGSGYDVTPTPVSPIDRLIQSGQGFLVQSKGVAGNLVIHETDKILSPARNVFRVANNTSVGLRVNLKAVNADGAQVLDEVYSSYSNDFSNNVDEMDALKASNPEENLAIVTEDQTLMVDRRKPVIEKDVIHLRLWNTTEREYILSFNPVNLNAAVPAYLKDNYLRTVTAIDLSKESSISINITSDDASKDPNRFEIVFSVTKPQFEPIVLTGRGDMLVAPNPAVNNTIGLQLTNQPKGTYNLEVTDNMGRVIYKGKIVHQGGTARHTMTMDKKVSKGIYRLKVSEGETVKTIQVLIN